MYETFGPLTAMAASEDADRHPTRRMPEVVPFIYTRGQLDGSYGDLPWRLMQYSDVTDQLRWLGEDHISSWSKSVHRDALRALLSEDLNSLTDILVKGFPKGPTDYSVPARDDINGNQSCNGGETSNQTTGDGLLTRHRIVLFLAVIHSKASIVRWLVEVNGADVNVQDAQGTTALILAGFYGDLDLTRLLLQLKADPNLCDQEGITALMAASSNGHSELVKTLIMYDGAVNQASRLGWTALAFGVVNDHKEVVDVLVSKGLAATTPVDSEGRTVLVLATMTGNLKMVQLLHPLGSELNACSAAGATVLMAAAQLGQRYIVRFLLQKGAVVNDVSDTGMTALMCAALSTHSDVVAELLKNISRQHLQETNALGNSSLTLAASVGDLYIVKLLLIVGADKHCVNNAGNTPLEVAKLLHFEDICQALDQFTSPETCEIDAIANTRTYHRLLLATIHRNVKAVRQELDNRAEIDESDHLGRTLLMAASLLGALDIATLLVKHGASVNQRSHSGVTALAYAFQGNHKDVFQFLLQQGAHTETVGVRHRTLMCHCVVMGDADYLQMLIDSGADLYHKDTDGKNAVMLAAEQGQADMLKILLKYGAHIESKCQENMSCKDYAFINNHTEITSWLNQVDDLNNSASQKNAELIENSLHGNSDKVSSLLNQAADVNFVDRKGSSALIYASENGHVSVVKVVLDHGAVCDFRNPLNGRTAIFQAVLHGHQETVLCLLQRKANPNMVDKELNTPLMIASQENNSIIAKTLIEYGAQVSKQNLHGWSALTFVANNGHLDMLTLLLEHKAVIDMEDTAGTTPLGVAAFRGNTEVVKFLMEHGADINHQDHEQRTPLMDAAQEGHCDVVITLLENNARTELCDAHVHQVFNIAVAFGHRLLMQILHSYGLGPSLRHFPEIEDTYDIVESEGSPRGGEEETHPVGTTDVTGEVCHSGDRNDGAAQKQGPDNCEHEVAITNHHVQDTVPSMSNEVNPTVTEGAEATSESHILILPIPTGLAQSEVKDEQRKGDTDTEVKDEQGKGDTEVKHEQRKGDTDTEVKDGQRKGDTEVKDELRKFDTEVRDEQRKGDTEVKDEQRKGDTDTEVKDEQWEGDTVEKSASDLLLQVCHTGNGLEQLTASEEVLNYLNCPDLNGETPLMIAIKNLHVEVVHWLTERGADVNCYDALGRSALMCATKTNQLKLVKFLVEHGADLTVTDTKGRTVLFYLMNDVTVLKYLLQQGVRCDQQSQMGSTLLMKAARLGYTSILRLLLQETCSLVDIADYKGRNALMHCCLGHSQATTKVLEILFCHGADLHQQDMDGKTALALSVESGNLAAANTLICLMDLGRSRSDSVLIALFEAHPELLHLIKHSSVYSGMDQDVTALKYFLANQQMDILSNVMIQNGTLELWSIVCKDIAWMKQLMATMESDDVRIITDVFQGDGSESRQQDVYGALADSGAYGTWRKLHGEASGTECVLIDVQRSSSPTNALGASDYIPVLDVQEIKDSYEHLYVAEEVLSVVSPADRVLHQDQVIALRLGLEEKEAELMVKRIRITGLQNYNATSKEDVKKTKEIIDRYENELDELGQVTSVMNVVLQEQEKETAELTRKRQKEETIRASLLEKLARLEKIDEDRRQQIESRTDEDRAGLRRSIAPTLKHTPSPLTATECDSEPLEIDAAPYANKQTTNAAASTPGPAESDRKGDQSGSAHTPTQPPVSERPDPLLPPSLYSQHYANVRTITVLTCPYTVQPKLFLFQFHSSMSQFSVDGRTDLSNACAIISTLFAYKFIKDPSTFPEYPPIHDLPDKVFDQAETAISQGNAEYDMNYAGSLVNLGPDDIKLMTAHLGVTLVEQTDVDTREPETLVSCVLNLKPNQLILFIKNYRVVSLVPCNDSRWILLFDSHHHYYNKLPYGSYLFYGKKDAATIKELFASYDDFCDPYKFYGQFAVFEV